MYEDDSEVTAEGVTITNMTFIPEPSAGLMLAAGGLLCLFRRLRTSTRC